MGGCIGLRTLLERADFCGAVFSAPMWHLQMRSATRELTSRVTQLANLVGLGGRLTPGASPQPTALAVSFEGNALTSDREHFAWMVRQLTAHPELGARRPEHAVDLRRARGDGRASTWRRCPGCRCWSSSAATRRWSRPASSARRWRRWSRASWCGCEGARHEIFMERPEMLARVWARIDAFLEAVPARRARAAAAGP